MLALRWHPDRNPHDPVAAERFREALDAYENLIDPSRRGRYDQVRRHKGSRTRTRRHERRPGPQRASSYTVEEILSELFGFDDPLRQAASKERPALRSANTSKRRRPRDPGGNHFSPLGLLPHLHGKRQ